MFTTAGLAFATTAGMPVAPGRGRATSEQRGDDRQGEPRQDVSFHGERIIPARGLDVQRLSAAGQVLGGSPSSIGHAPRLLERGTPALSRSPPDGQTGQVAAATTRPRRYPDSFASPERARGCP